VFGLLASGSTFGFQGFRRQTNAELRTPNIEPEPRTENTELSTEHEHELRTEHPEA